MIASHVDTGLLPEISSNVKPLKFFFEGDDRGQCLTF